MKKTKNKKGRPRNSYKYRDPRTNKPITYLEYNKILKNLVREQQIQNKTRIKWERQRQTSKIDFILSPELRRRIENWSRIKGISLSEFVRMSILNQLRIFVEENYKEEKIFK